MVHVCAKYQKAFVPADFLMYALSKHKHNPYLIGKREKSSQSYHFVKNYYFGIKLLHTNVQCVYIVWAKYQIVSAKAVVRVDFPTYALSMHKQNALRIIYKGQ